MSAISGKLAGKVAVITGAGAGIGKACALRFAAAGATVAVASLLADECKAVVTEIKSGGGNALSCPCDVTQPQQINDTLGQIQAELGRVDILLNNAGGAMPVAFKEQDDAYYRLVMKLNLESVHYAIRAVLPIMLQQGSGNIISISSGAGINYVPGLISYGAAKAGLTQLTRGIAVEYGGQGIRANVIAPGLMDTEGVRAWLATQDPDKRARFQAEIPVGRLGAATDIAHAALFLASDESSFISGVLLPVDGAVHARLAVPG